TPPRGLRRGRSALSARLSMPGLLSRGWLSRSMSVTEPSGMLCGGRPGRTFGSRSREGSRTAESPMKVVKGSDGRYALTGMSEDDVRALGALADFPVWAWQPPAVAGFCNRSEEHTSELQSRENLV